MEVFMRKHADILILSFFCLIAAFLLAAGCSDRTSAPDIGGTWVRFDFQGNRFVLQLDPADGFFAVDLDSDGKWNVSGTCAFENGEIAFVDTAGDQTCPDMKGRYRYFRDADLDDHLLHLWLVEDSCSGRAWVTPGDWLAEDYRREIDRLDRFIAADSADRQALYRRGRMRLALRQNEKAFEDLNRAIELGLERAEAYAGRGLARVWMSRDYEGGLADYNRAIELDPAMAEAYVQRGRIKLELNKKFAACKDWETAFELGYAAAEKLMLHHCRYLLKDRYLQGRYPEKRSSQEMKPE
jgi:hypothetical protein